MSEEKMYMVKNDEGYYWSFNDVDEFWQLDSAICPATVSETIAKNTVEHYGGHVVTLIEEPEKAALTKEQAEIVDEAHDSNYPANYISDWADDEKLLMRAYVNGYTVENEKKYLVYKGLGGKHTAEVQYAQAYRVSAHPETLSWIITSWVIIDEYTNGQFFQFTESEIEHYGLQDCEKEEVTD